jgi:hypothetical protein
VRDKKRMTMTHLREYISTQPTGHFVVTSPMCADVLPACMTKPVIVAKARITAEDAL